MRWSLLSDDNIQIDHCVDVEGSCEPTNLYSVLPGPYTFAEAEAACSALGMTLASFSTPAEATAAFNAVGEAGFGDAWTAAWRDMTAMTWGWFDGQGANTRVEWHVLDLQEGGCYMADVAHCAESTYYATDCYSCGLIDDEAKASLAVRSAVLGEVSSLVNAIQLVNSDVQRLC
jgi:hypothetical protein